MGRKKTKKHMQSDVAERQPTGLEQVQEEPKDIDPTEEALMETVRLQAENAQLKERDQKMEKKIEDVLSALREARLTIEGLTDQQQELQRQVDAKDHFIHSLVGDNSTAIRLRDVRIQKLSQEVVALQKTTDSGLEDELKKVKGDRKRLLEELEKTKFDLHLVLRSDESREHEARIRLLEGKVSELETEKEQIELENVEKLRKSEEKIESDWQMRYEKALNSLQASQSTLQETKDAYGLIEKNLESVKLDNDRIIKELDNLRGAARVEASEEILTSETRITIDDETKQFQIICPTFLPSHPAVLRCKSALEKFCNKHLMKDGAPVAQPLIKKIRSVWGRRPFRPYFRIALITYLIIVHVLLFSYWFG